jgi:murein DD-endopeptidase MepM/ murein hydrolase activator NlpD
MGAVLAIPLAALVLAYTTVSKSVDLARLQRLDRQNRFLAEQLERTQLMVAELTDTMTVIVKRNQQVRILAGLEPTDPEVSLAGIGGPRPRTETGADLAEEPLGQSALSTRADVSTLIRRASLLAKSFDQALDSLSTRRDKLERTPSIWPTDGWLTSSYMAARIHPIHGDARPHEGIDVSAPMGAPIRSSAGGLVIDAGNELGFGLLVTIDHGYGVVTRYAHCSKILVRVGQRVKRGEVIALVGNTGIATGPHLHYEVLRGGRHENPRDFIFPKSIVD